MNKLKISANAHQRGAELLVAGGVLFLLVLIVVKFKPEAVTLFDIAIIAGALFAMLLGYLKLSEPRYNMMLSENGFIFCHRYGKVRFSRSNIAEVGQVSIVGEDQALDLPCIGIKFKDLQPVIQRMPARLALKLLMEQRNWLIAGIKIKWPLGNVPDDWLMEPNQYQSQFKTNGLLAMLTHRLEHFEQLYGYHFLISYNYLDRSSDAFLNLLQHWLRDPEKTLEKCCNINK